VCGCSWRRTGHLLEVAHDPGTPLAAEKIHLLVRRRPGDGHSLALSLFDAAFKLYVFLCLNVNRQDISTIPSVSTTLWGGEDVLSGQDHLSQASCPRLQSGAESVSQLNPTEESNGHRF
jgi:hypothetical protein